MKKVLIVILVAVLLIGAALTAFLLLSSDFYKQTRDRLEASPKTLILKMSSEVDGECLSATYKTSFFESEAKIEYSFEEFALFELKDGVYVPPTSRVTTELGSILLKKEGPIQEQGKKPPLAVEQIILLQLSFYEEYFADALITETAFEATVKDVSVLPGLLQNCSNVRFCMTFDEEHVNTLTLSYKTASGSNVMMEYTFVY